MRKHLIQIVYAILAWFAPIMPFATFVALLVSVDFLGEAPTIKPVGMIILPILLIVYAVVYSGVIGLGIVNIVHSFRTFRKGEQEFCFDSMIIMKYGMIPFFLANLVSVLINHMIMIVAGHGITLIFIVVTIPVAVFITYLYMLPGAFWGLQTVRLCENNGLLKKPAEIAHGILQYIFVADIASTAYLSIKVCKRWKKLTFVGIIVSAVLVLALGVWIFLIFA